MCYYLEEKIEFGVYSICVCPEREKKRKIESFSPLCMRGVHIVNVIPSDPSYICEVCLFFIYISIEYVCPLFC